MLCVKSLSKLDKKDWEQVTKLLLEGVEYVDNPLFRKKTAEDQLFGVKAGSIPQPQTSWYAVCQNQVGNFAAAPKQNVLLNRQQEATLFLRFNYAKCRLSRIIKKLPAAQRRGLKRVPIATARQILNWQRESIKARNHIVSMNLAIVISVAKRLNDGNDGSDLVANGNLKIVTTAAKFDVSRGFKFSTYLWYALQRGMFKSREEQGKYNEMFPCDITPESDEHFDVADYDSQENWDDIALMRRILDEGMAKLDMREDFVLRMRFFQPRPDGKRYTLQQVGDELGVSRGVVQLAERAAVKKIRSVWDKIS